MRRPEWPGLPLGFRAGMRLAMQYTSSVASGDKEPFRSCDDKRCNCYRNDQSQPNTETKQRYKYLRNAIAGIVRHYAALWLGFSLYAGRY